ncbi:hypothetical protein [Chryseobacterium paludis]|uniref:hypothetical protein n=1 Tax=Chryseobacterium paludis TaxID=2956784 RepID=UPI0021C11A0B|nr:hypothetical protein [Chryseobacterium paludis]
MSIDAIIKKQVIQDWINNFPELSLYGTDKLYKVIGPVIIGLELIKLPRTEEYRPHFVIYPLWKEKTESTLKVPILLIEYDNKKGLQYNIPYKNHYTSFYEALDSIKKQTPLSFTANITLKQLESVLDKYSKSRPLSAAPNSYLQALLHEAKLRVALFIGVKEAEGILDEIIKREWDTKSFNNWKIDMIDWFKSLHEIIANRDEFLKQIEVNKLDKKISKLNRSELVL